MLSKSFTTILLASTTALAACGGGGGGGGTGGGTPIKITNLGSVNTNGISSGFASVIQQVSQDGMVDAKETVAVFEWVNANKNIDTAELAKYNVDINGSTYTLMQAWNMLRGYKKLYYDGKEDFWSGLVDSGEYNDENDTFVELKQLAQNDDPAFAEKIGTGEKSVEDFKKEKGVITKPTDPPVVEKPEPPVVEEPVEPKPPVVEEPVQPKPPVVEEPVEPETPVVEPKPPVVEEPVEPEPPVVEPKPPVVEEPVVEEPVVEDPVVEEPVEPKPPMVEKPVEPDPITIVNTQTTVNKTYSHLVKTYGNPIVVKKDTTVTVDNGYTVTTETKTIRTPEFHEHFDNEDTVTTITYSDGTQKATTVTVLIGRGVVEKNGNTVVETKELSKVLIVVEVPEPKIPEVEILDPVKPPAPPVIVDLGPDHADMGTRTSGYVADVSHYQTDEFAYLGSKSLSISNFDVAYSRGWTGKGSTIVIADTGANTAHADLDGNIKHTNDFTGNGIGNNATHGTHVAGIAGAERNGVGGHGAAFDADIAIAKVSSGTSYSFQNAQKAAAWGKKIGSVAINVSAEVNYDMGFRKSIVKQAQGVYYSNHWFYGVNGYNGAVDEAKKWKTALGDEQVLVKAAGNAGWDYSAGMNQMATATDTNGNLILDGQMIVVGNYDKNNDMLSSSSNKAGTVCATYTNGVCIDAAQIKDYYIMANGTAITSTAVNGGYTTMSGTSMAAPVVTGSIAVLHQMWPHMKGKHLVQLVLVTGNKNIVGYNENVHGQGLLDMDKATQPVGATGIPTSGRTNGGVSSVAGGANVQGVAASQMQALTSVMVLDSFERDFYIDLGDMTQDVDTRTASVAEQMGAVNYFADYMNSNQHAVVPFAVTENSNLEVGFGTSTGHYLGNSFQGTLGTTKDSNTVYANWNYTNSGFYAQAGVGYTNVNFDMNNSMMVSAENVVSTTATAGYEFAPTEGHTMGFAVSQPVTVESARFTYKLPTSRTLDGNVNTQLQTVDFRNADREIDLGTYYKFDITKTGFKQVDSVTSMLGIQGNLKAFAELRNKIDSVSEIEKRGGINLNLRF